MIRLLTIFSLVLYCLVSFEVMAQEELTTSNKKAIKLYKEAQSFLPLGEYELAIHSLNQALEKDPGFLEARLVLGEVYAQENNTDKALEQFSLVIEKDPSFYPPVYFTMGRLEMGRANYSAAEQYYKTYLGFPQTNEKNIRIVRQDLANCQFAIEAIKNPVPFEPVNMGSNINSENPEYFPCLTADEGTFLFTRRIPDGRALEGQQEDFFFSIRKNGEWQRGINVGSPINSVHNEGAPTLSVDGQYLIFTACDLIGDRAYGPGRSGAGSCDLFISKRFGDKWSKPRNMGNAINSRAWETQPSFSSDGRTLYFIRGKHDGDGFLKDQDIWVTTLVDGKRWSKAEKLSDVVNTPGKEESVYIHPDGKTLYFASDGHPGMGGLDIFKSVKGPDGKWSKPVNLGYPINTSGDENSFVVSASGTTAFFSSDREGGAGSLDIYSFSLPEELRPEKVTYMKGRVYDEETKKPLEANFELIDLETGEVVINATSDKTNGNFLVCLPANHEYALNVAKENYLFYSENFELKEKETLEPYRKDVPLKMIKPGESIVLKNVFFDTDKYDLKSKSQTELNRLVKIMEKHPELKIEIGGHTDNQGSSDANITLSENRAKAVAEYLTSKGVSPDRIVAKGYGQDEPIDTNETAAGRANNRRTEFKILSI